MRTTKKELIEKAKAFINDAIVLLNKAICQDSMACNLKITISSKDKCLVLDDSLDKLILNTTRTMMRQVFLIIVSLLILY